ncbi:hypothetical protein [Dyella sp. C9]|uniref:hypothetical protein n=1 Tax=Dyella sp. C9 TaxID=2202154 RepID=UPI000DEFE2EB|nr:hypothetical protein [Dyella sp. C9]
MTRIIFLGVVFLASQPWTRGATVMDVGPGTQATPTAAALTPAAATAGQPTDAALAAVQGGGDDLAGWTPVSADTLDDMRGGYDVGEGLEVSFGIDRAVYVNGNLVTSTSFNIPDVAHITAAQAAAMEAALNSVTVVQIGPNNSFNPASLSHTQLGTVIQNSLNNQNIQTITTLNTSVNTLDVFRQMNFQQSLQQAELNSLGH